jgi:hypothetical protein
MTNKFVVLFQWTHTNERQVMLRNLHFEASGTYFCEVSTETPIYTKPSNDELLTVFRKYNMSFMYFRV